MTETVVDMVSRIAAAGLQALGPWWQVGNHGGSASRDHDVAVTMRHKRRLAPHELEATPVSGHAGFAIGDKDDARARRDVRFTLGDQRQSKLAGTRGQRHGLASAER